MPLFLINARDKAGSLDLRLANRTAHLAWAAEFENQIAMAGPVFTDDGETMAGSTFVISFDTRNDAIAWAESDPYAKAGLFDHVEIALFKWSLGAGKPGHV
ncbi:MAG: YciI family protein [Henriciella sp.]|nr:YciI family protein [Henriciella sp.]